MTVEKKNGADLTRREFLKGACVVSASSMIIAACESLGIEVDVPEHTNTIPSTIIRIETTPSQTSEVTATQVEPSATEDFPTGTADFTNTPKPTNTKEPTPTLPTDSIIEDWERGLVNGGALIPTQRVILSLENSLWENGKVSLFYMRPGYNHKIIRIKELEPGIKEVTWGFNISGNYSMYKLFYTEGEMIRPDGSLASFGQSVINLGDTLSPQVVGMESLMSERHGWENEVFTDSDEGGARKVYRDLESNSDNKERIRDFWSEGIVFSGWKTDAEGIIDLTNIIVQVW